MTTPTLPASGDRSRLLGTTAAAFFFYAILVLALLHALKPEYAPTSHYISEYALGRYGWLMGTFFLALGAGALVLAFGLSRSGLTSRTARVGTFVLGVLALTSVVAAACPMDPPGGPATLVGTIHAYNFYLSITALLLTQVLLSLGFGREGRWRSYQSTSIILTSLLVLAYALQFVAIMRSSQEGLANRFFGIVWIAWLVATALRLRRLDRIQER